MRRLTTLGLLLRSCAATPVLAQTPTTDPMAGTWKLNVTQSTFAGAAPQSIVYRYENRPDGFTLWVSSTIGASGNPGFSISLRKYDGRNYPAYNVGTATTLLVDGARTNWTQASRMVDAYTTELENKTDGVVTQKVTRTMARDGKSFTMRTYDTAGALTSTQLFEKVELPPS